MTSLIIKASFVDSNSMYTYNFFFFSHQDLQKQKLHLFLFCSVGFFSFFKFFPLLLRYSWHASPCKFKVMMVWFTYVVKWRSQLVQLTPISWCRYNTKKRKTFFSLWWELSGFTVLTSDFPPSRVDCSHRLAWHPQCWFLLETGVCDYLHPSPPVPTACLW